jgi:hypothetical protein
MTLLDKFELFTDILYLGFKLRIIAMEGVSRVTRPAHESRYSPSRFKKSRGRRSGNRKIWALLHSSVCEVT